MRRSRFRLIVAAVAAVFLFALTGGDAVWWPLFFVLFGAADYLATRNTLTAVRRLHEDATPAGDDSG